MTQQKWEYAVFDIPYQPKVNPDILEAAGKEGWEAIGISIRKKGGFLVILCKRPISEP
jgi:hypothetical protein